MAVLSKIVKNIKNRRRSFSLKKKIPEQIIILFSFILDKDRELKLDF